jgi:hypothetical protein
MKRGQVTKTWYTYIFKHFIVSLNPLKTRWKRFWDFTKMWACRLSDRYIQNRIYQICKKVMKWNEWYIPDKLQQNVLVNWKGFVCYNDKIKKQLIRFTSEELSKVKYAGKLDGRRILCLWSLFVCVILPLFLTVFQSYWRVVS